jgi:hypothetical protein
MYHTVLVGFLGVSLMILTAPAVSTVLAQSANHAVAVAGSESAVSC